jgi:AraC family transcriptional regulator
MAVDADRHRAEFTRRMHRACAHIDSHLDQPLDLESVAAVAHFSAFHFHRLFTAWAGETVGEYRQRRRLEVAALRLEVEPDASILDVALGVGFGSAEAFARAFKTRFGSTPSAWRGKRGAGTADKNSKFDQPFGNRNQDLASRRRQHEPASPNEPEVLMKVHVIERPPARIAYLRHVGPYGEPISTFWQEEVYPWMVQNDFMGLPRCGVIHDDPQVTAAERCRYDAGVELPAAFGAGQRLLTTTVAGGRYAMTPYLGTADDIGATWSALLRDWLPASGQRLDARPFFEYYPADSTYDPETGIFSCQLMIPVIDL